MAEPARATFVTPAPRPRLCQECTDLSNRWLDTTPQSLLGGGVRIAAGAAYDDTAAGAETNRRDRHERWRAQVRDELRRIRETCAAEHQS